jgi:Pyruvate/2-oxoacid:ferredoxin oxidoreductase delta subunit
MDSSKFKDMRFYTEEETQKITGELEKAVTIPVHVEIEAEHRVYDMSEMREILMDADRIALQDCGCKTAYNNCDAPKDVCLSVNKTTDELLADEKYASREITVDEAMKVLEWSHEAGLVHMSYTMAGDAKPGLVCSCCACCCHTLGSLVRNGIHTQVLTSKYIAIDDTEKCTDCGICVDRCVFQARSMVDGKLVYDNVLCHGCGLCISTCATGAISLIDRKPVA